MTRRNLQRSRWRGRQDIIDNTQQPIDIAADGRVSHRHRLARASGSESPLYRSARDLYQSARDA
jgi:hypothetical protein